MGLERAAGVMERADVVGHHREQQRLNATPLLDIGALDTTVRTASHLTSDAAGQVLAGGGGLANTVGPGDGKDAVMETLHGRALMADALAELDLSGMDSSSCDDDAEG